ncbi:hypothetical protein, partial [Massilia solisilvae]
MHPEPNQPNDADLIIDLPPTADGPVVAHETRAPLAMDDIKLAIARVEAEAKANCAAGSRAAAEAQARQLAE